ncbi:MaoC/PaaZ C-terminal domain-containing protein [Amycolatopsis sp. GM8]|uniref:MaoC/PaaZ C-terminal domain-containing protein n=1 Tax=Amycolatopsis sp. GM8 TaxID=2896530 RepID=UPI001F2A2413|nr:MaoC/PaaZ C-terminal domain-containing protein [Amycolatopsis sp. GM8]
MKIENPARTLAVGSAADLHAHIGSEIGISGWASLEQDDVLGFAELTHDRHWIHTDPARARDEAGLEGLLAHGFLVLSTVTALANQCYTIAGASRWTNYGLERIRFTAPVFPGDEFRLRLTVNAVEPGPGPTTRLVLGCLLERRAGARPALAATWIVLVEEA